MSDKILGILAILIILAGTIIYVKSDGWWVTAYVITILTIWLIIVSAKKDVVNALKDMK